MSHFITPPSPHWPGPHPTGFHTSRSTMSNPFFFFFYVVFFFLFQPTLWLFLYCHHILSSVIVLLLFLHVLSLPPCLSMYTEETVCDASEQWMDNRYDCLRAEERGEQQKLASCEVWARGWFSVVFSLEIMIVCVCMYLIYIFVWHRGRMFYIRFVLFTVWPYSKLCCQYARMIEYSNSEAKFSFINTMIVSALKDLAVKARVSLWTACVMLGSRRWSFAYCIFIHQGALSRCLKEILKGLGAAQMLVAGSSFKKCRK